MKNDTSSLDSEAVVQYVISRYIGEYDNFFFPVARS